MEREGAAPRVKDHGDPQRGSQMVRIAAQREQRARSCLEQEGEDGATVLLGDGAKLRGEREDQMERGHWQHGLEPLVHPLGLSERLALRAMSIAARVVQRPLKAARRAHLEVPAERFGPASLDGDEGRLLFGSRSARPTKRRPEAADNVRNLEGRSFRRRKMRVAGVHALVEIQTFDWTLYTLDACRGDVEVDGRRRKTRVSKKHLDRAQVDSCLEKMRRERMTKRVRTDRLRDARPTRRSTQHPVQNGASERDTLL